MASRTLAVMLGMLLGCRSLDRGPRPGGAGAARRPDGVQALRIRPSRQAPPAKPAGRREEGTQARRGAGAPLRRAGRRHGLQGRAATGQRAGDRQRDRRSRRWPAEPSQDYAGLFRAVPGVNVTQTSARDLNITSRGATGTLSTTQLALIDGRSVYLDFFGFVGWDFLPVNFAEIKQVEVIRGPGVGHLGRQRDDRRREHHHEVAARDAGHVDHHGLRHLQPRRRRADDGPGQRRHCSTRT